MAAATWVPLATRFNFIKQENHALLKSQSFKNFEELSGVLGATEDSRQGFPAVQFPALHAAIDKFTTFMNSGKGQWSFYSDLLPRIISWATEASVTREIVLLESRRETVSNMTASEARFILANAFFLNLHSLKLTFAFQKRFIGTLDFSSLYKERKNFDLAIERVMCLLSYFEQQTQTETDRLLSFERLAIQNPPRWRDDQTPIDVSLVRVHSDSIESSSASTIVDFSNKDIHNGEVGASLTQEEILFSCCPECFLSLLLTEQFASDEAMIIRNVRRFSKHSGFMNEFKFEGFYSDNTITDVIVIDANRGQQFHHQTLDRDLNKAWRGFSAAQSLISTGNWGCGTCGGDKTLKFLEQLCVATITGKRIDYSTFYDLEYKSLFEEMLSHIHSSKLTVAQIFQIMSKFNEKLEDNPQTFTDFARQAVRSKDGDWTFNHLLVGGSVVLAAGFFWRMVNMTRWIKS